MCGFLELDAYFRVSMDPKYRIDFRFGSWREGQLNVGVFLNIPKVYRPCDSRGCKKFGDEE